MLNNPFIPAWWLRNAHLQTLWANVVRRAENTALRRERLELPDGDFVDLDWTTGASGPVVIVLHGLQGSSNSSYARGILRALHQRGYRAVLMHFRGCSGEPNRLPRFYHGGETGDLNTLVNVLHAREPHTPLAAVGYSLGGNVLLKWLGEQGQHAPLTCAVAVSVPFDMNESVLRLQRGLSRFYQRHLLRCLRDTVREKSRHMRLPLDIGDLDRLRTLRTYDDAVTAPLHGFAGVDDYYTQSSCRQYLGRIGIPTLVLHAADDPFLTRKATPTQAELSPHVTLELSGHGGHVGFVYGSAPWRACYWLEERIPAWLEGVLASYNAGNMRETA
ncbi:MAG: hydrolase [Proteobacteria bacterium]|nr:hydrolase [Pseudomonadota bacterium]